MKLIKLLKVMCVLTALALIYIHMQMQILELAYRGKAKETQIRRLVENNGQMTYAILTLKSATNIGSTMLAENSDLEFVSPEDIVHVKTPQIKGKNGVVAQKEMVYDGQKSSIFSALASFGIK